MSVNYNFSEYNHTNVESSINNSNSKAVKTVNGDLFIISIASEDSENGKIVVEKFNDNIISFFSETHHDNKPEALQQSLFSANEKLAKDLVAHPEFKDIKVDASLVLFDKDHFNIISIGKNRISLFSDGKVHQLTKDDTLIWNPSKSTENILLKKGDVLVSSTSAINSLSNEDVTAVFNSSNSVAQKTKDLLDNSVKGNLNSTAGIQTIEITESNFNTSIFKEIGTTSAMPTNEVEEQIIEEVEEPIAFELEEKSNNIIEENKKEVEIVEETFTTKTVEKTPEIEKVKEIIEEDILEKEIPEKASGFNFKNLLYILIPLLLAFLAYKYVSIFQNNDNDVIVEEAKEDPIDGKIEENTLLVDGDSIPVNEADYPDAVTPTNSTVNTSTTKQNTVSNSSRYFIIGENNKSNNTYRNIYQFKINSGTKLSMDDIILLNPDYKQKKTGDKVLLE